MKILQCMVYLVQAIAYVASPSVFCRTKKTSLQHFQPWKSSYTADVPLHIYAHDKISCPSPGHIWIASGKVTIKKANLQISADCIHLEFEPDTTFQKSNFHKSLAKVDNTRKNRIADKKNSLLVPIVSRRVKSILALGNVIITHPAGILHSNRATYTFSDQTLYATGSAILLKTEKWNLSCEKSLTYSHATGLAHAVGKAQWIAHNNKGFQSQEFRAQFGVHFTSSVRESIQDHSTKSYSKMQKPRENPALELHWVKSNEPIRLWNKEKQLLVTAHKAYWDALNQKIHLNGSVHLRHQKEYISGQSIMMDFKKNSLSIGKPTLQDDKVNRKPCPRIKISKLPCPEINRDPCSKGVWALIPTHSFSAKKKGS